MIIILYLNYLYVISHFILYVISPLIYHLYLYVRLKYPVIRKIYIFIIKNIYIYIY